MGLTRSLRSLAFEYHKGRVLQRMQTLNWDTATVCLCLVWMMSCTNILLALMSPHLIKHKRSYSGCCQDFVVIESICMCKKNPLCWPRNLRIWCSLLMPYITVYSERFCTSGQQSHMQLKRRTTFSTVSSVDEAERQTPTGHVSF